MLKEIPDGTKENNKNDYQKEVELGTWETGGREKLFTIYHVIIFVFNLVNVLLVQKDFNIYFHYDCHNVCLKSGF